jgi:lysophospholipase L1-like esterase
MPGLGDTDQGYVDALYETLKAKDPSLELVKLGCSGETVVTLVAGGRCRYEGADSQLEAATRFLRAHRGAVTYVTLDIGANDLVSCASGGTIDTSCALTGLGTVAETLPGILRDLRRAGGHQPTYAGMTYYDPLLATWLLGESGQATARLSVWLTNLLNGVEAASYVFNGFRVAPVSSAFKTNDFSMTATLPGFGIVPVNVFMVCTLTFACSKGDIHATVDGYRLIAATFAAVLRV